MTAKDLESKPQKAFLGIPTEQSIPAPVAAVILAAGGSARMGEPKQLLVLQGQPMVRRVTGAVCAAGLAQVVVVIGAHAQSVKEAIFDLDVDLVVNSAWREGMGTSVRAGIRTLSPEIQAALTAQGISYTGMRAIEVRMEEAFISLIHRQAERR